MAARAWKVHRASTQVGSFDEGLAAIAWPPAEETRRLRDKQLIDQAILEQVTNQRRSALAEDDMQSLGVQQIQEGTGHLSA